MDTEVAANVEEWLNEYSTLENTYVYDTHMEIEKLNKQVDDEIEKNRRKTSKNYVNRLLQSVQIITVRNLKINEVIEERKNKSMKFQEPQNQNEVQRDQSEIDALRSELERMNDNHADLVEEGYQRILQESMLSKSNRNLSNVASSSSTAPSHDTGSGVDDFMHADEGEDVASEEQRKQWEVDLELEVAALRSVQAKLNISMDERDELKLELEKLEKELSSSSVPTTLVSGESSNTDKMNEIIELSDSD